MTVKCPLCKSPKSIRERGHSETSFLDHAGERTGAAFATTVSTRTAYYCAYCNYAFHATASKPMDRTGPEYQSAKIGTSLGNARASRSE